MALNNAEKELIRTWAATVSDAATWLSGPRAKKLDNLAEEMISTAAGEKEDVSK